MLLHLHVYFLSGHFYAVANVCRCFYCAKVFWVVVIWLLTSPESPQIIFWSLDGKICIVCMVVMQN